MKKRNRNRNIFISILLLLSFACWCCGYEYYQDNQLIKSEKYSKYKQLTKEYENRCDSWEYNNLYYSFSKNKLKKLKQENDNLKVRYDASKIEKRYKSKVKESIDSFWALNIYLEKIYKFQSKNKNKTKDINSVKNKDFKEIKELVQACKNIKYISYFIPILIDKNKKISDKLELLEITLVDLRLEKLDIKKAKRGYELLFDYMYKQYGYYLDEIEYKLENYNNFLSAFGFDRDKELDKLKTILTKSSYMDNKDKYWQKRYFDKIDKIKNTKIKEYNIYFKWDETYHKQKLLLNSYLKKYSNKTIKVVPNEVLKIAEDFILISSVYISMFGDSYHLGFVKDKLVYIGHAYMGKYGNTNVNTIKNTNYYIKDKIIYKFDVDLAKYFKNKNNGK